MAYRKYWKKKKEPTDLEMLGYEPGHLSQIIRDTHKNEIICSKCSEKIILDYFGEDNFSSGPYGLYFTCLKCKQFSSLKVKFAIDKDPKLKELNSEILYFNRVTPKAKKNFKKIRKRIEDADNKNAKHNEPIYKEIQNTLAKIWRIKKRISNTMSDFKQTSLVEDVSEFFKLKDPRVYNFVIPEPYHIYENDNGGLSYWSTTATFGGTVNYFIKNECEKEFHKTYEEIKKCFQDIKNLEGKLIRTEPHNYEDSYYEEMDDPYKEELIFLIKYCRKEYGMFDDIGNPRVFEKFEKEHYKPLLKEKQKRINLLKKVFRLTNGYIYVLHNEIMPNLYKVGWTERSPEERAEELSATGLPEPFKVVFSVSTDMSIEVEKKIHEKLDEFRYRSDREFFKTDLNTIKEAINKTLIK